MVTGPGAVRGPGGRAAGAAPGSGRRRRRTGRRLRHRRRVLHRRDGLPAPGSRRATRCGSATSGAARSPRSAPGSTRPGSVARVTGDTMLGCGHCRRCLSGRQHVCDDRFEIGIRGGFPGALAEQLAVPVDRPARRCPTASTTPPGRWSSPAATRCARSGRPTCPPGIGCWSSAPAPSACSSPSSRGPRAPRSTCWAPGRGHSTSPATLGFAAVYPRTTLPALPFDAVIDASHSARPARARAGPGRARQAGRLHRPVGHPEPIDTRTIVLKDVTAVGILSASARSGRARSRPTPPARSIPGRWSPPPSGWTRSATVLAGWRPPDAGAGPRSTSTRAELPLTERRCDERLRRLVAVVTGGASGIGAATAALLAGRGARVAVLDRDVAGGDRTAPR